ncbi:MAG: phage antirepressor KilAC domain-containing protein [Bacilli bacterium]
MEELFAVNTDTERVTLSARELHKNLEISTDFSHWFPRMVEFGFEESVDFNSVIFDQVRKEGNREVKREIQDYQLTINMAKEIAMLQRNERGKQVRQYLIKVEEEFNSPEKLMARALKVADTELKTLRMVIEHDKPKVDFYNAVSDSKSAIPMDQVAKVLDIYGLGRNKLFEVLRNKGILQKNNIPYQTYVDRGYFRVIESKYTKPNGETNISIKTLVYQKGIEYIRKQLSNKYK